LDIKDPLKDIPIDHAAESLGLGLGLKKHGANRSSAFQGGFKHEGCKQKKGVRLICPNPLLLGKFIVGSLSLSTG